jgi:3-hydroxybutyryl-CoA dehydrogenase
LTQIGRRSTSAAAGRDEGRLQRVGVVGAGTIGLGVAQALAQSGHDVTLVDRSADALAVARTAIGRAVRVHHLLRPSGDRLAVGEVLPRITFTEELDALGRSEFVIENITEDWDAKRSVFTRLDAICPPACAFAANTSAIPIARLAAVVGRSERVLGIHFMNPVPLKDTVEVIRGSQTSDETLALAIRLLDQMGKSAIVVNDSPGFVSNRVLMLTVNEAAFVVQEGVASAEDVDGIFRSCFGHPMGPLATADLIGLDTVLLSIEVLHEEFADDKYRPCPLLQTLVDAGALGRKSGRGFFEYGQSGADRGAA